MAKKSRAKARTTGETIGPLAGVYDIDTGTCELVDDRIGAAGWILKVNGVESSHIDTHDPRRLDFEYMRWIARLAESHWDTGVKLRALHLGGGACSLARYLSAVYPAARQVVVELDGRLADLVREWFDLPRSPLLRIRKGEARAVIETLTESSRDLVIRDVFAGNTTPYALTTMEFTEHVRRVLAPGGIYVVNCGDTRDLVGAKREAATIGDRFQYTAIIADPAMLKGRRYGNIVIAGSDVPIAGDAGLARELLGGGVPATVWSDERVRQFVGTARILTDRSS